MTDSHNFIFHPEPHLHFTNYICPSLLLQHKTDSDPTIGWFYLCPCTFDCRILDFCAQMKGK